MLYSPCIDRIRKIPSAMRLPQHDIDEITQQALVNCLEHARSERQSPTIEIEGTITRRRCRDYFRVGVRDRRRFPGGNDISNATAQDAGPAEQAEQRDDNDFVRRAVASLAKQDRDILRLGYWKGLSYAQIAIQLGCTEACVRKRMERARNRVKPRLERLA
jgi:RNA polymerase sigma factor (sigma-70 family)